MCIFVIFLCASVYIKTANAILAFEVNGLILPPTERSDNQDHYFEYKYYGAEPISIRIVKDHKLYGDMNCDADGPNAPYQLKKKIKETDVLLTTPLKISFDEGQKNTYISCTVRDIEIGKEDSHIEIIFLHHAPDSNILKPSLHMGRTKEESQLWNTSEPNNEPWVGNLRGNTRYLSSEHEIKYPKVSDINQKANSRDKEVVHRIISDENNSKGNLLLVFGCGGILFGVTTLAVVLSVMYYKKFLRLTTRRTLEHALEGNQVSIAIINRAPCPLPLAEIEENIPYRYYETPYEWRIWQFGRLTACNKPNCKCTKDYRW